MKRIAMVALLVFTGLASAQDNTIVRIDTPVGHFNIELFDDEAPATVANFLNYLRDGDYDESFFHRNVSRFVVQGGAFRVVNNEVVDVPADPPIQNEFGRSNVRGTVAMAKINGDPNSATNSWFINVVDNTNLDTDNGGFTVFGQVVGEEGMQVVDTLNSLFTVNAGGALTNLPVYQFDGQTIRLDNLVMTAITERTSFANPGLSGTWFNTGTPGQGWLVDIFQREGEDNLSVFVAWFTYDVNDPPTDETAGFASTQHRWLTADGSMDGDRANLTLRLNTGGVFNQSDATTLSDVGTMTIDFTNCTNGTVSWDFVNELFPDGSVGVIKLSPDQFCVANQ